MTAQEARNLVNSFNNSRPTIVLNEFKEQVKTTASIGMKYTRMHMSDYRLIENDIKNLGYEIKENSFAGYVVVSW